MAFLGTILIVHILAHSYQITMMKSFYLDSDEISEIKIELVSFVGDMTQEYRTLAETKVTDHGDICLALKQLRGTSAYDHSHETYVGAIYRVSFRRMDGLGWHREQVVIAADTNRRVGLYELHLYFDPPLWGMELNSGSYKNADFGKWVEKHAAHLITAALPVPS